MAPSGQPASPTLEALLAEGNKQRDKHLRSADFFDAASHPYFTFAVDGVGRLAKASG